MTRRLRPSRRTRLRLTLLVVLSLLVQQAAMAAYVCASADMQAGNAAMAAHCDGMPMAQAKHAPALCTWHCAQQSASTQGAQAPTVPPLPAFMPLPASLAFILLPASQALDVRDPELRTSGIPPALRFRVLLI